MGIRYEPATELQEIMNEIAMLLFPHVKIESVVCIRSHGSSSRGTIARCHALGKAMMLAMGRKDSFYVIEVISKRFDKMSEVDQIKTLIHELMHIPRTFGGGFVHHNYVNEKSVEREYQRYVNSKKQGFFESEKSKTKEDFLVLKSRDASEEKLERKRKWW